MGTNLKDSFASNNEGQVDIRTNANNSPQPNIIPNQKQDLNMTAPLHSEQVKNGRKLADYAVSPI